MSVSSHGTCNSSSSCIINSESLCTVLATVCTRLESRPEHAHHSVLTRVCARPGNSPHHAQCSASKSVCKTCE